MDRNLNAKATMKDQLNNVVKGRRTGKLTLKETSSNAVEIKSNENAVMNNLAAGRALKGNTKYIVNGQPVVTKAPKINRRCKEQKAVLNNISNKPLASAKDKDGNSEGVKNGDGQLDAVRVCNLNSHFCCMSHI